MNTDMYLEILLKLSYIDIVNMCFTSTDYHKIYQSKLLWHQLILRDFNYDIMNGEWSVKELKLFYEKLYHLVDKTVIKIIYKNKNKCTINNDLEMIYNSLFILLGQFYNDDLDEDQTYADYVDEKVDQVLILFGIQDDKIHNYLYYKLDQFNQRFGEIDDNM